jgi:hypothetical protein
MPTAEQRLSDGSEEVMDAQTLSFRCLAQAKSITVRLTDTRRAGFYRWACSLDSLPGWEGNGATWLEALQNFTEQMTDAEADGVVLHR